MRFVPVQGEEFTLSSSAAIATPIALDTVVALDRGRSVPIPGGNAFALDTVAGNGSGDPRRARDWFYIPDLAPDGLNMYREKADNATTGETDTGACGWLEFDATGASAALVRGILRWNNVTAASSAPDVTESLNGTWPGNVVDSSRLLIFGAFVSRNAAQASDSSESHFAVERTGTTITVTPGGVSPDMDIVLWAVELTGEQHEVETIQLAETDWSADLAAATAYSPGSAYAVGDTFSARVEVGLPTLGKYVVTADVADAPALDADSMVPGIETFTHFVGWDTLSFERDLAAAVDWQKSIVLPPFFSHGADEANPSEGAQVVATRGSTNQKVSFDIGYPDQQRVASIASRKLYAQVWSFNDPNIRAICQSWIVGGDPAESWVQSPAELDGDRDNRITMTTRDEEEDPTEIDAVGTFVGWTMQNSDDRSSSEAIAGNWGRLLRYSESALTHFMRRSYEGVVHRFATCAFTGIDLVNSEVQPPLALEVISGDSRAYRLRATLATPLAGGVITQLRNDAGDTLAVNVAGATDSVAEFDITHNDHVEGGALAHAPTGSVRASFYVENAASDRSVSADVTLPGDWQYPARFTKDGSPLDSVQRDHPTSSVIGDILNFYSATAPDDGRITRGGSPYNEQVPWTAEFKFFRLAEDPPVWSSALAVDYTLPDVGLSGDYILPLSNITAGSYTLPAPWVNHDGAVLESDGDCIFPTTLAVARFRYDEATTNDVIEVSTSLARSNDNDTVAPGIYTSDGRGYVFDITTTGTEEPDRIEFRRIDAANLSTIENLVFAPLAQPLGAATVTMRYVRSTGIWSLIVNDDLILSRQDFTYQSSTLYGGMFMHRRNTNGSCVNGIAIRGLSQLQVATINSSPNQAVLTDGATITLEYTQDHAPADITLEDDVGTIVTLPVSALGAAQGQVTLAIGDLRKGDVILRVAGITAAVQTRYPAPTGYKFVNLGGTISSVGVTAAWAARNQLTYRAQTEQGNAVTILDDGHIEIEGGSLFQSVLVAEHDSGVYGAEDAVYVYQPIDEDFNPPSSMGGVAGSAVDFDLLDHFNATVGLPQDEAGSVGTLSIVSVGLSAAGLAISGTRVQGNYGAAATYPATVTVTDPDGVQQEAAFSFVVTGQSAAVPPASLTNQTAQENVTGSYNFEAWTDPEGDPVTYSVSGPNYVSIPDPLVPTLVWDTPPIGTETVTITGASTSGDTTGSSLDFTLTVVANTPAAAPASLPDRVGKVGVNQVINFQPWTDAQADPVIYSVAGVAWATIPNNTQPSIQITSPPSPGDYLITVTGQSTAGNLTPSSRSFTISVADTEPPEFVAAPVLHQITQSTIVYDLTGTDAESAELDYYLAVTAQGDSPTGQNIANGVQSDGSTPLIARAEALGVPAGETRRLSLTGLNPLTPYQVVAAIGDRDA